MIRFLLLPVLLLASISTSELWAQTYNYETLVIDNIDINILNAPSGSFYKREAIFAKMKTKVGLRFSQIDFDEDLKILAAEYDDIDPVLQIGNGSISITLNISLKPTIASVRWNGIERFNESTLLGQLGLSIGSTYDRAGFNQAVFNVQKFYVKNGFFESEVNYSVNPCAENNTVDITIDVFEGRSGKIREVKLVNFTREERAEIEEMLVTRPWNFVLSFFAEIGVYSEERMLQDQFVIINFLQNRGYADATVTIEPVQSERKGKINIVITAIKGEQYNIGDITMEGNCLFTEEEIRKCLKIAEGDSFSPEKIHNAANNIRDLYGIKGYIDATVEFEPTLDLGEPLYHLHFLIEEGEQYRIGLIRIIGNLTTCNSTILHECILVPGEFFDIRKLKATEIRLRNIGYFSSVNVYAVRSEEASCDGVNYRDVVIEVCEQSTGNFSAFLGFSSMENLFGGFEICEKNFNIRGLGSLFSDGLSALRGGGEYAFFKTTIGSESLRYQASWAKTHFRDTPWVVGIDFDRSWIRYIAHDYYLSGWGFQPYARYPIDPLTTFGVHYRFRNSNTVIDRSGTQKKLDKSEADLATAKAEPPSPERDAHIAQYEAEIKKYEDLFKAAATPGLVSAVGSMIDYDSTDHPVCPTYGLRSRFNFEFVGVAGNSHFFNTGWLSSFYYPLFDKGVFKLRADAKFIFPLPNQDVKDIPLEEKFFLGGIGTIRGYKDFGVGPELGGGSAKGDNPAGGISLGLFSVEYTYRHSRLFEPFLFFDAGTLSENPFSFWKLTTSAGVGLRTCIIGNAPLILGYGWPIHNPTDAPTQRFFFSLGGSF